MTVAPAHRGVRGEVPTSRSCRSGPVTGKPKTGLALHLVGATHYLQVFRLGPSHLAPAPEG